jgi:hypothetical protein
MNISGVLLLCLYTHTINAGMEYGVGNQRQDRPRRENSLAPAGCRSYRIPLHPDRQHTHSLERPVSETIP